MMVYLSATWRLFFTQAPLIEVPFWYFCTENERKKKVQMGSGYPRG